MLAWHVVGGYSSQIQVAQDRPGQERNDRCEVDHRRETAGKDGDDENREQAENDAGKPIDRAGVTRVLRRLVARGDGADSARDDARKAIDDGQCRREHRREDCHEDDWAGPLAERTAVEIDELYRELCPGAGKRRARAIHDPSAEDKECKCQHAGSHVSNPKIEQRSVHVGTAPAVTILGERPDRAPHRYVDGRRHPACQRKNGGKRNAGRCWRPERDRLEVNTGERERRRKQRR